MTLATTASTAPKPFCFVLMPFSEDFDDVYRIGIKEACEAAGAYCERVDEQIFNESILDRVYNQIAKADFVIADMTGRNANVFYEVGYAHALGKPTCLLTRSADDIPFDLKHYPHIIYEGRISDLRARLQERVSWFVEHPEATSSDSTVGIELYCDGKNLASEHRHHHEYPRGSIPCPEIVVKNASSRTYRGDAYRLSLLGPGEHLSSASPDADYLNKVRSVDLPDGRILFVLPSLGVLFPQDFTSCVLGLFTRSEIPDQVELTWRVATDAGARDYLMVLQACDPSDDSLLR